MKPALLLMGVIVVGCASSKTSAPRAKETRGNAGAGAANARAATCEAGARPAGFEPIGADVGSTVALVRYAARGAETNAAGEGHLIAYVADEDTRSVRTIDVDAGTEIAVTPLLARPSQLLVLRDGRMLVALRDKSGVEVLGVPAHPNEPLGHRCTVGATAEPVALAIAPDQRSVLVASRWGHALGVYETASMRRTRVVNLARDPQAVATTRAGDKALVAHAIGGRVSVVDLGGGSDVVRELSLAGDELRHAVMPKRELTEVRAENARAVTQMRVATPRAPTRIARAGSQAFAAVRAPDGRVLVPEVLVDTGRPKRATGYGDASVSTVIGDVAAIDSAGERAVVPSVTETSGPTDCLLPRAAAIDPVAGMLLVACFGIDSVIAYDAASERPHDRERARYGVGSGPTGIAVDVQTRRAVVWSQFSRTAAVLPLAESSASKSPSKDGTRTAEVVTIATTGDALASDLAMGRRLFHAAGGRKLAFDGRACASCHPDGRDDGLTWSTPDGPRQTPMLLGRLEGTAPYGWDGDRKDIASHFARTMERLGGQGATIEERDALFAYVSSLASPAPEPPGTDPRIARGAELFHSESTGCSTCHLGDETSTDGVAHDVGTATPTDQARAFDTPSLRFVARTAPYLHDGRYASLEALLRAADRDVRMGHTSQLSDTEIRALAAYLETL